MSANYISDDDLKAKIARSPFWTLFVLLRERCALPPAVDAWVREWRATRSPFIRLGMIQGLLLADEMAGWTWPKAAKRQAIFFIDHAVDEWAERISRPVSLTIPQDDDVKA